ncbi:MAG: 5'-methylthioadenosine/S-adenosylhomocysteine nucleosidase [Anaeroplasmataceae bacterium]
MIIGIIETLDSEARTIRDSLGNYEKKVIGGVKFYRAQVKDNLCILVRTLPGKVNVAHATSLLISHYKAQLIISSGAAVGACGLNPGDLFIGNQSCYFDVDMSKLGYQKGEYPGLSKYFIADSLRNTQVKKIIKDMDLEYKSGTLLSGDKYIISNDELPFIPQEEHVALDMEGSSIAHIAFLYKVPVVIIRSISKVINNDTVSDRNCADICLNLINKLF